MNRERGQSMVEFAVGATALALLLLGIVTIAGYQEVQRRMAASTRQAAFEYAWDRGRVGAAAVRHSVAMHLDAPGLIDAAARPYLQPADLTTTAALRVTPGLAQPAARAMLAPMQITNGFLGGNFDLRAGGLLVGNLSVLLPARTHLPLPFADMTVPLQQDFALLTDAWNAADPSHVRRRVSGLVPTSALSNLQALWEPLQAPLSLVEPSLAQLCFGLIEPDRIPEDRLGAGTTPPTGRCP